MSGSITVTPPVTRVDEYELGIFLSKSGDFWVDDIEIIYQ